MQGIHDGLFYCLEGLLGFGDVGDSDGHEALAGGLPIESGAGGVGGG